MCVCCGGVKGGGWGHRTQKVYSTGFHYHNRQWSSLQLLMEDQTQEPAPRMMHGLSQMLNTLLLSGALAQNRVQALEPEDLAHELRYKSVYFLNLGVFRYKFKLMLISCLTAVEIQSKHGSVLHLKLYTNTIWIFWFITWNEWTKLRTRRESFLLECKRFWRLKKRGGSLVWI